MKVHHVICLVQGVHIQPRITQHVAKQDGQSKEDFIMTGHYKHGMFLTTVSMSAHPLKLGEMFLVGGITL